MRKGKLQRFVNEEALLVLGLGRLYSYETEGRVEEVVSAVHDDRRGFKAYGGPACARGGLVGALRLHIYYY